MKVGVRAHDFGRKSINQLAEIIGQAGFECVQLAPTKAIEGIEHFNQITDEHLEKIKSIFSKENIEITVLGCYVEPSLRDKDERLEQVEFFKKGLANAKRLEVSIVGTETTHLDIDTPHSEREKIFQLLKDSVLRMVEVAEKEDVIVGIEPVAEHTLNTPELTGRLLDEVNSKKLKVIFDPVNLVLPRTIEQQREIFSETFDLLGNDIVAMHIKDIVIEDNQKAWRNIGAGVIDYDFIFSWLIKHKPDMRLLREGVNPDSYQEDKSSIENFYK
ncbi:MAG: sugar phosphate isomerase/epimerase [Defluviitaleaceae bacterium]|nr:sugar phosphate isomerase/epimerase [Defluviitaleaceae bacterium]